MKTYTLKDGRSFILRQPRLEDAAVMIEHPKRVGAETDFLLCDENGLPGLTLERERDYIQNTLSLPGTAMFLGFVGEELVSLCDVRAGTNPRTSHNGRIAISVLKDYWHLGIGGILMQAMIDFARASGTIKNLQLEVRADNARAIALYERFGFRQCGRSTRHIQVRGEYFDELSMELLL
jgi:ribosomal protein S18 acetylase RimI-like enzyme